MTRKPRTAALRKAVREALELRLDALDAVLVARTGDNIRYSIYCEQKLMEAIEQYHDAQHK